MKKEKSKLKESYMLFLSVFIILGLILLIIGQEIESAFWESIINNIAATLFISGGFGLIDQYILKEKLIELILEKIQLKEQINKTGIEDVFFYINDIDYRYYLKDAKNYLDIVHIYGRSWTTSNIDILRDKLLNSNCQVRVVLLSPDSCLIPGLAEYFCYTEEQLRNSIVDVTKIWEEISQEKENQKKRKTTSTLSLYYHKGMPAHSLYRMDDRVIFVSNKLAKGRTTRLPSMVIKNTKHMEDLYCIYLDQIEKLIKESECIDLNKSYNI
ncbi:hypothetical protein [Tissierella praeacuta]|uniref:hypothetical protein n=1 Tax=Tissierella praeacuta TaxID=43131 RepID=UPI0028B0BCA9|nr:hypothetical protein [Tissierella praeacuta]